MIGNGPPTNFHCRACPDVLRRLVPLIPGRVVAVAAPASWPLRDISSSSIPATTIATSKARKARTSAAAPRGPRHPYSLVLDLGGVWAVSECSHSSSSHRCVDCSVLVATKLLRVPRVYTLIQLPIQLPSFVTPCQLHNAGHCIKKSRFRYQDDFLIVLGNYRNLGQAL